MTRGYHNLTAHYNVYFNGKESLKAGQKKIADAAQNDYTQILPVFEHSDPANTQAVASEMDRAIEKGSILITKHSITKKPKKKPTEDDSYYKAFYNQKEFNKWVDDAYMLIGKGNFYKREFKNAILTFDHVIRDFSQQPSYYDAMLWKAASYAEMGDYTNARLTMNAYDALGTAPASRYSTYMTINADLQLKQLQYEAAIPFLKGAIESTSNKKNRIRLTYILAQVLQEVGRYEESQKAYEKVISLHPSYEMVFNANINRVSMITPNTDTEKMKRDINRMLNDKKNIEYRDRIYYAMALVYNSEGNDPAVIENLKLSTQASIGNDKQKASSFIMMGDIYYNKPLYKQAYQAYDSALLYIKETDPAYTVISDTHESLQQLVTNIDAKERQDSLQTLANMPEIQRLAFIDKMISDDEQRKADAAKRLEEQQEGIDPFLAQNIQNNNIDASSGKWYFYNLGTVSLGKTEFVRRWGRRRLEDNWRRSDKSLAAQSMGDEEPNIEDIENAQGAPEKSNLPQKKREETAADAPLSRETLLADIPLTPEAKEQSDSIITDALLSMGIIYRDKFNDLNSAIESFETLLTGYPKSDKREITLIELYRTYKIAKNEAGMLSAKERISTEFPNGNFTEYLNNPEYLNQLEAKRLKQDKDYQSAYDQYLTGQFNNVIAITTAIEANPDENILLPKYRLIKALSYAKMGNSESFQSSLSTIVKQHPKTEEAEFAQSFLDQITQGRTPVKSEVAVVEVKTTDTDAQQSDNDAITNSFKINATSPHSFVVWIPASTNTKRLLFNFADFNFGNYLVSDYDLNILQLPDKSMFLEVKTFNRQSEAMEYFYTIRQHPEIFTVDGIQQPIMMVATTENLKYMVSSGDVKGYIPFFMQVYLKGIQNPVPMTTDEIQEYIGNLYPDSQNLKKMQERKKAEELAAERKKNYFPSTGEHWFAMIYPSNKPLDKKLQADFEAYNRNQPSPQPLQVKISSFSETSSILVVSSFATNIEAAAYQKKIAENAILLRNIRSKKPELFTISPENYDVLVSSGDIEKYKAFLNTK